MDQPYQIEPVSSAHLLDCISHSVSTNGQTIMLVFTIAGGVGKPDRKFALTYPSSRAKWLSNLMHEMVLKVDHLNKGHKETLLFHFPMSYSVGHATKLDERVLDIGNGQTIPAGPKTVLIYDKGSQQEFSAVMPNVTAVRFAEQIIEDVVPRMGDAERAELERLRKGDGLPRIVGNG